MFTGIIKDTGTVLKVIPDGANLCFWIESRLSNEFKIDQSVSHNGVCLTVEEKKDNQHRVTGVAETLRKTNLDNWIPGTLINIEQSLRLDSRLDGHLVQGHVDTTAICTHIKERKGSYEFSFSFAKKFAPLIIEKGSVCINGISLTAFDVKKNSFKTAIIPYTYEFTNMRSLKTGEKVNVEFDLIGKYILRIAKV
jgi:riboflavin synthase